MTNPPQRSRYLKPPFRGDRAQAWASKDAMHMQGGSAYLEERRAGKFSHWAEQEVEGPDV